jgi:hypothetical protein
MNALCRFTKSRNDTATARRGGLVYPRNVYLSRLPAVVGNLTRAMFSGLNFYLLRSLTCAMFSRLNFCFFSPDFSRFHLVQSSRLEWGRFVCFQ